MGDSNLRYAILGLIASRDEGVHGYQLRHEVEALSDDFWQINYGRLYRVLDVLDKSGDLSAMTEPQENRPNRKVYRITERGRKTLDDWLLQPVYDGAKPLRDELALKLLFLERSNLDAMNELIKQQRSIYITRLARIARRRRRLEKIGLDGTVTEWIMDGAEMRVKADLAWLDHIARKIALTF